MSVGLDGDSSVEISMAVDRPAFKVRSEQIAEDVLGGRLPTRLGIDLAEPVVEGRITVTIVPANQKP